MPAFLYLPSPLSLLPLSSTLLRHPRHPLRIIENPAQDAHFALLEVCAQEQAAQALDDRARRAALVEVDVVESLREVREEVFQLVDRRRRLAFVLGARRVVRLRERETQFIGEH